ncbi:hypothetical protein [Streptomyces sp. 8N616]|uniref:hypothetical protein n=1 Tax=Streptomyces sp. 8N616 TaxID=3457414 RepID=UPI003FD2F6C6
MGGRLCAVLAQPELGCDQCFECGELPGHANGHPDEHGRGIAIVTALSARCGVRIHPGGITRWADLPAA